MPDLDPLLASLTPERLRQAILGLIASRPPGERTGLDVSSLVAHLTEGCDLGAGAERSRAYRRLIAAIQALVGGMEGLRYVKSSD